MNYSRAGVERFSDLLQAIIDGVLTGGVYALMAAGLTLIFGVMDIINIAQGAMVVLGAYLSYALSVHLGIDLFLGLLITDPGDVRAGRAVESGFMRRLREHDRDRDVDPGHLRGGDRHRGRAERDLRRRLRAAPGVLRRLLGARPRLLPARHLSDRLRAGGGAAGRPSTAMLYRTKFGRAVRASLQNRTAADLIGINVNRTRMISVGIGVAVTAVGGMVFGATNAFNPNSGYDLISRLLAIVILGGMGSIGGAMAAAVLLLVLSDVVAVAWSPPWAPLVFFAALVIVLSIRPAGPVRARPAARE